MSPISMCCPVDLIISFALPTRPNLKIKLCVGGKHQLFHIMVQIIHNIRRIGLDGVYVSLKLQLNYAYFSRDQLAQWNGYLMHKETSRCRARTY